MRPTLAFPLALLCAALCTATILLPPPSHQASLQNPIRQDKEVGETCSDTSECTDDSTCIKVLSGDECSPSDTDCDGLCEREDVGLDPDLGEECSCNRPCRSTLICLQNILTSNPICTFDLGLNSSGAEKLSCSGNDGDDPEDDGACIDVDMLRDFASHELVFEKHVLARVLCDKFGSCATKGHIVHYKGAGMMMGSYCDIVGCEEKVMEVNSPRYRRGLRVTSRSKDMAYTALAARYGTVVEETVLAGAVRVGL